MILNVLNAQILIYRFKSYLYYQYVKPSENQFFMKKDKK